MIREMWYNITIIHTEYVKNISHIILKGVIYMYINDNFFNLKGGYLFPEIQKRTKKFKDENPDLADKVISLGIGDVTRPVPKSCIKAMH